MSVVLAAVAQDSGATGRDDDSARGRMASRCLEIAARHPGTASGLSALFKAATRAPKSSAGIEAARRLAEEIESADFDSLAEAIERDEEPWERLRELAPAVLARVRRLPDHPKSGRLLAWVCELTRPPAGELPPAPFEEAADLILESRCASPDLARFCELFGSTAGSPTWAGRYERHLRAILQQNQQRAVRCAASFALATLVDASGDGRLLEAEQLYERFRDEYAGEESGETAALEPKLRHANRRIASLRALGVGRTAVEIRGLDLDGQPMNLSEHRGRVVLLDFWATWSFPWTKFVTREIELQQRFREQPFVVVGINGDADASRAQEAGARLPWRSFQDRPAGAPAISSRWKVLGFPTLHLLDHHGILRKRWFGAPAHEELARTIGVLVEAARKDVPLAAMRPFLDALAAKQDAGITTYEAAPPVDALPGTGFISKVHEAEGESPSKYVVFVPPDCDGTAPVPAILYLHGAGARGSDGRAQIGGGLAKAIRGRHEDFPFLAIFPQAHLDEDWIAGTSGGRRALAILDEVRADYRIDPARIVLSGASMGGHGTWSLAAADPARWAAIVPVCGGGRPETAERLKDMPCWAFHGETDSVVPVNESRAMVEALRDVGGRPLYHEFAGVGHRCWDTVYAMPDLFEWLLQQRSDAR